MECEMCGKKGPLRRVTVSGTEMMVCPGCAKFGTTTMQESKSRDDIQNLLQNKARRFKPRDVFEDEDEELVDDVGTTIRRAREKKGMTIKELGMKINEREGIISKIESNKFRPDDKTIRKLERILGVKLLEKNQ